MLEVQTISTSASALLGRSVVDAAGKSLGRVKEFAVDVPRDEAHIAALVLERRREGKKERVLLPVQQIVLPQSEAAATY